MAKCPLCGETIEYLIYNWTDNVCCTESYDGDYRGDIDEDREIIGDTFFSCPDCMEELTRDEEEADKILKTEEIKEVKLPGSNPNNNIIIRE